MRFWAFAFVAAATSMLSLDAAAYCRTSTEGLKEGCRPAGVECCTAGMPVYWKNACIGFSMNVLPTTKRNISFVLASRTLAQAFGVWTSASCPSTGSENSSRVSIDVRQLPPVECGEVKTALDTPNQNVIVFRDSVWNHRDPDNVLALTTVSFDKKTGIIRGADLEFNTANVNMVCPNNQNVDQSGEITCFDAPPPAKAFDFASIVTHEVGHFLGMAHSNSDKATMAAQYSNGDYTLRTLTADDIAGICNAYPPDHTRNGGADGKDSIPEGPCDPTPLNGFSSKCAQSGCSVAGNPVGSGGPGGAAGFGALGAFGALALIHRLRRRPWFTSRRTQG
jgi:hypothetical protein